MCYVVDKITIHHSVGKVEDQNLLSCPVDSIYPKENAVRSFNNSNPVLPKIRCVIVLFDNVLFSDLILI